MSNAGGRIPRHTVSPETMLIDLRDKMKIVERYLVSTGGRLLGGTVDPDSSVGAPGDWYINTVSLLLFGPKTTTWPAGFGFGGGATSKGCVIHADDADVARPIGYGSVEWIGSVQPNNAVNNDTWTPTTVTPP